MADHSERSHALLGASSAKRWIACPPSAKMQGDFEDKPSVYAEEGTLMHEMAELILLKATGAISRKDFNKEMKLKKQSPLYNEDLLEATQVYTDFCTERYNRAKKKGGSVEIELRVDYSKWVPEGFGTTDFALVTEKELEIADLKGGQGVPVSAVDNPQLRLYALGALEIFSGIYDIETVRMHIIQPRRDSHTTDVMSVEDLIKWAESEVKPAAELAFKGEGEFKVGEHCQFCRVKATCRARAEANLELVKEEFSDVPPEFLTGEEIAEILDRADEFTSWIKDVKDFALQEALTGDGIPGYKVVEGRSKRVYSDPKKVEAVLSLLYDEDTYMPRELLPITKLEKAIGKKAFAEVIAGGLVVKSTGAATLVKATDPRPEMGSTASAVADFSGGGGVPDEEGA